MIEISPLLERNLYAHYVRMSQRDGAFLTFYECEGRWQSSSDICQCKQILGPILVGVDAAIRSGRWRIAGKAPVHDARIPNFLMWSGPDGDGKHTWWLYDGITESVLGHEVSPELQGLETLSVWPAELVEDRLATGKNPMAYDTFAPGS